jgi:hypothetical protein
MPGLSDLRCTCSSAGSTATPIGLVPSAIRWSLVQMV